MDDGYYCEPKKWNPSAKVRMVGYAIAMLILISHLFLENNIPLAGR